MLIAMYRGEKKEHGKGSASHQSEVVELLILLEQNDNHVVEEIKMLIHEQLNNTKEAWLLHGLVDYYMATQSSRCLEIIVGVREPHDKHLFDKLADFLKGTQRYPALLLLGHLVRRHPSWLHKIAQHRVMHTLLNVLKTDKMMPNLMSAVLVIVALLPAIPSLIGSHLPDIFEVFSRLAAWNTKKPGNIPAIYILHLHVAVYALFHRLYAMYPCNFLAYLRSYYGRRDQSQESFVVFTETIKPMLERVRLHPLLVTASKETELTMTRWKKMEIHDIIVECAKVSLDLIEGTREDVSYDIFSSRTSGRHGFRFLNPPKENGHPMPTSANSKGAVWEASLKCQATDSSSLWSPSVICEMNSLPPNQSCSSPDATRINMHSSQGQVVNMSLSSLKVGESPPLDVAVEAKPEESSGTNTLLLQESSLRTEEAGQNYDKSDIHVDPAMEEENVNGETTCSDQSEELSPGDDNSKSSLPDVSQAEEAREEDIIDKEVSEIVSNPKAAYISGEEIGHDTPFFSTTQKLTDDPQTPYDLSLSDIAQTSSNSQEEELESSSKDCQMIDNFVHRLRCFSYRGPAQTEVLGGAEPKSRHCHLKRCKSCPDMLSKEMLAKDNDKDGQLINSSCIAEQHIGVGSQTLTSSCLQTVKNLPVNTNNVETTYSFVPVQNAVNTITHHQTTCQHTNTSLISPAYSDLFPLALQPLPVPQSLYATDFANMMPALKPTPLPSHFVDSSGVPYYGETPLFTTVSPPELLDRHLQLGNEIYMKESNIPLTSTSNTDWTHFGGHAPVDEINILRGQILLLHNQLLFERHKREIHAERNRRLLGKAKQAWSLEEQNSAMKDQLSLQEQKIQDLAQEVNALTEMCQKWQEAKHHQHDQVMAQLRLLTKENMALKEETTKINEQLIQHKQEKDVLRSELRKVHSTLSETKLELEAAFHHVTKCQRLEEDSKRLAKEVLLLSEMNQQYKERIESLQNHPDASAELSLIREAAASEISALQQKLDVKTSLLEASKARISQVEESLQNSNLITAEQKNIFEKTKECHLDIVQAKEKRISALQAVCQQQVVHILDLEEKLKLSEFEKSIPVQNDSSNENTIICYSEIKQDSPIEDAVDSSAIYTVPSSNHYIDSKKAVMEDLHTIARPTSLSRLSQEQLTYQNLENCVNDTSENNGLQSLPSPTNSNGCTLDNN